MKKILVYIIIFFPLLIIGQNPSKGFKALENKDYAKAKYIFKGCLGKVKYGIVARYGLAKVYSADDNKNKNNKLAYTYISRAEYMYSRSGRKQKDFLENKFGITKKEILNLKNKILDEEQKKVIKSGSTGLMSDFLNSYPDTKQAKRVEFVRDSIIYNSIKKYNSAQSFKLFYQNYPNTVYADSAKKMFTNLILKEYHKVYRSLELSDIENFRKKYPDFVFYDDSAAIYKSLAQQAQNLKLYEEPSAEKMNEYEKFIKSAAPSEMAFVALQRLIAPYLYKKQWSKAIKVVEQYKPYFKGSKKIEDLIKILQKPYKVTKPYGISPNINTQAQEYAPVITADGNTLYFCSQDRKDQINGEDIYVSHKKNGIWQKPILVDDLSSYFNEAPMSITADGNQMLIFYNGDIYITEKDYNGWTPKKPIKEINTEYWEGDAFITADGNAILFTSDRPENIGGFHKFSAFYHGDIIGNTDIYVIVKTENGWSEPINLGPAINTPYAERTPFLHPDMKTLYFSSDGRGGLGRMDVYKTTRLNDTSWTQWSEPINLGKEINTPRKEYGYKITTDGKKAYYAKILNNEADIMMMDLPQEVRPQAVAVITGFVTDKITNTPLFADIVWEDLESGKKLGNLKSSPEDGKYVITLPMGKNYGFFVSRNGYYPLSGNLDLRTKTNDMEIRKDFKLLKIKDLIDNQTPVELENVFFDYDKYSLKPESYPELNRLADFIKQYPELKIEISGHTDNRGEAAYNQKLSENRANAVRDYLIQQGCNPSQLITIGYGDTKPIAENNSEEGRQKNRRVEFRIIKN